MTKRLMRKWGDGWGGNEKGLEKVRRIGMGRRNGEKQSLYVFPTIDI